MACLLYSSPCPFLIPGIFSSQLDSLGLMEWSDKRREMTFVSSAEEIAFMVKETDKCGL